LNITELYNNTEWENSTYYDVAYIDGPYENQTLANELKLKINETCDDKCIKKGSEWSHIYAFSGFTLILMSTNSLFLMFGGWVYKTRMIGMFCHDFLTFLVLISFIVTWRYRYRDQGKLAAMSNMPSHLKSETQYDMTWTYKEDAEFIHKILIWQGVCFLVFLCTGNLGCFKIFNGNNVRDSQVTSSFKNSNVKVRYNEPDQQEQDLTDNQQQLLNPNNE